MTNRTKYAAASLSVLVAAGGGLSLASAQPTAPVTRAPEPAATGAPSAATPSAADDKLARRRAWVEAIKKKAAEEWGRSDIAPAWLAALQKDLVTTFTAILEEDFEAYDQLLASRGAILSERVDAFAEFLFRLGWLEMDKAAWAELGPRGRYKYLWTHPETRHAVWKNLDVGSIQAGSGLVYPPGAAGTLVMSVYNLPGEEQFFRQIKAKQVDIAWVDVAVELSGGAARLRFFYAFHVERGCWFPYSYYLSDREPRFAFYL